MIKKAKTIGEYIKSAPKESWQKLRELRACIRKAVPGSEESLKWGMPAVSYKQILVMYAGFKHHIGFYPTPSVVKAFAKQLKKYKTAKGSIQFPLDKPLPIGLIRKITLYRICKYKELNASWRS